MRRSIRIRYTAVMIGVILALMLVIALGVNFGLEKLITRDKQGKVLSAVEAIEDYVDHGWNNERGIELSRYCATNNMGIGIYDLSGLMPFLRFTTNYNLDSVFGRLQRYVRGDGIEVDQVIRQTDEYVLYRVYDQRMSNMQIECIGQYGDKAIFMISTSVQSIEETVKLINRYLLLIGVLAVILGGIVAFFVGGSFARPIVKLSELSGEISNLDFSGRYEGGSRDEIGLLGSNMNLMSQRLRSAITELTTANAQLEEDIREKERIDEARKQFLANVSHELKTPIALIQGYSEGLKEGIADDDPEMKDYYVDVITDEARKMNTIVQRLLSLDEIESGTMELDAELFDLIPVLSGTIQNSAVLSRASKVSSRLIAPESLMLQADEFLIEQAVRNLLSNAYHHVSEGGAVTVRAEEIEGQVRITVRNTGDLIPEEDVEHIWEKFYKVDKARTRAYGGSGIGLSIVAAIMDKHHGTYAVRNTEDGAEFTLTLPQQITAEKN